VSASEHITKEVGQMTSVARKTIRDEIEIVGLGIRSGRQITVRLLPAEADCGITVTRSDLDLTWPVDLEHTLPLPNCTSIGDDRGRVDFVEHLMAVLWSWGITDVQVAVDGPEIPLLDGSALPFYQAIETAGQKSLAAEYAPIAPNEPIFHIAEDQALILLPADAARFSYSLVHPHPLIGHQFADLDTTTDDFGKDIAPARTFVTEHELQQLQQAGMIAAGSEENCLVVYDDHYSQPPFVGNALARHKLLDLLGDLYLLGRPLSAHVLAYRTGHADNQALARRIAEACT